MKKRIFTNEFKAEAVKLALSGGKSVKGLARDLGVSGTTLDGWVRKARSEGVLKSGTTS